MGAAGIRRIGVVRADRGRPLALRLLTRVWLVAPGWLRAAAWRGIPRSRMQRALVVDLARWAYERLTETGVPPAALFSPAVEVHQAPELLGSAGTFHGHAGLKAVMEELRDAWGVLAWEPEEVYEFGDRDGAIVVVRARNQGLASGVATDRRVAHVYFVEAGSIARFDVHWEPSAAFEAVATADG